MLSVLRQQLRTQIQMEDHASVQIGGLNRSDTTVSENLRKSTRCFMPYMWGY